MGRLQKLLPLSWFKFVYYNFLCRSVKRDKGKYLFPNRRACIELGKNAQIILHANMYLNTNKYPGSRAECYLRLREGASMTVTGAVNMMYNGTIEVHRNAALQIGASTIQSGAVIVCAYKMTIGQECLFARMSYLSDSDHHQILNEEGETTNYPRETVIGDHVWVGVKATIMKGAKIKSGCVIGADSLVGGHIKEHQFLMAEPSRAFSDVYWSAKGFENIHDRQSDR